MRGRAHACTSCTQMHSALCAYFHTHTCAFIFNENLTRACTALLQVGAAPRRLRAPGARGARAARARGTRLARTPQRPVHVHARRRARPGGRRGLSALVLGRRHRRGRKRGGGRARQARTLRRGACEGACICGCSCLCVCMCLSMTQLCERLLTPPPTPLLRAGHRARRLRAALRRRGPLRHVAFARAVRPPGGRAAA